MNHKEYRKLHAEWYELVSGSKDHSTEIEFWVKCITASGEPVLELGSGTGRVLVPLLERGFDIVGIDTSADMIARCLAACEAKGLKAEVHHQSMVEFDLPRECGLIFLDSGGLGLFVRDRDIHSTFERVMAHLKPGGLFVYEFEHVPSGGKTNEDDSGWTGDWVTGPDDVIIAWRNRSKYNATTHVWERLFVVEKFVRGCLVETEANERSGRFFTVDEAVGYARSTGFRDIKATHWLTDNPPSGESGVITVQCRKPE